MGQLETLENPEYLTKQLITYLGNKRALLEFIGQGIGEAQRRMGRRTFSFADVFSGSGIVSRYVKKNASFILSNDLEGYCANIARCYLSNPDEKALQSIYRDLLRDLEQTPWEEGFLRRLYAPRDENQIRKGERVFYTPRNAGYLDACRRAIGRLPREVQPYFIAPLLSEASVKCNTSGVFKGFYKDKTSGVGTFGGSGKNALSRILAPISLPFPVFSRFTCAYEVSTMDAADLAGQMEHVDIAYLDPPYNQHPYGSNYFMLNLINDYQEPTDLSAVSGIPAGWKRSDYNKSARASEALGQLCQRLNARFLLVSFNSEGFITDAQMRAMLSSIGRLTVFDTAYNVFRGSRNLRERTIHNSEYLYLVEKE